MPNINAILIGYGEIGKSVFEVFSETHEITVYDKTFKEKPDGTYTVLLVCIPYSENFVEIVNAYREEYGVKDTIIFSTVAIGTTRQIPDAVHSPVEGRHPKLAESIRLMPRWVGGFNKTVGEFFKQAGFEPVYVTPETTEFLKLQSTSNFGLMIEYARYVKSVCGELCINYRYVKQFNLDYNILYKKLGLPKYQRYILDPPEGNTGGHCIVPNARILDEQYPSLFLKEIYRDKEATS
ncbi:MAG: hypothetical protein WC749_02405 [Dehalococcoidia bacterium]